MKMKYSVGAVSALTALALGLGTPLATAQFSANGGASLDSIRGLMEQSQAVPEGAQVVVNVNQERAGISGNLEHKIEFEDESSSSAQAQVIGRIKYVLAQGNLRTSSLPGWSLWLHVANERGWNGGLGGTPQASDNVIYEFFPSYETRRGPWTLGAQFGLAAEGRYSMNEAMVRPYAAYQINDKCRAQASLRYGHKYLELNGNDPDFVSNRLEMGASCFVGAMTIAGINVRDQRGRSINDDGGVLDVYGQPWPINATSKDAKELRFSPFIHHRFKNEVGVTFTLERAGVTDKARNDYFQSQDRWTKLMAFVEYPVRRDWIVYGELSYKQGNRTVVGSNLPASQYGFERDYTYKSKGLFVGINHVF